MARILRGDGRYNDPYPHTSLLILTDIGMLSGVADGASRSITDILALNVRTEIAFGRFSDGCTSLAWHTSNNAFLAQNWDVSRSLS